MTIPVGIVGLGAIGGSLALALRRSRAFDAIAWAAAADDREAARHAGVRVADAPGEIAASPGGIIVLAVPLHAIADAARGLGALPRDVLVVHTGSLQRPDALGLAADAAQQIIGTHPMAGTHATGFGGASGEMFRDAMVSVESRADVAARERIESLWRAAGAAHIAYHDAEAHDALMAWVSHLPQLAATAIAAALAEEGIPPMAAGPGARDTMRLAQSSLALWQPILERAPAETRRALRAAAEMLRSLERALESGDFAAIETRWDAARRWRASMEDR